MIWIYRQYLTILTGRNACKLDELPIEMRLIAVPCGERDVDPSRGSIRRDALEGSLKSLDTAVKLGSQSDSLMK